MFLEIVKWAASLPESGKGGTNQAPLYAVLEWKLSNKASRDTFCIALPLLVAVMTLPLGLRGMKQQWWIPGFGTEENESVWGLFRTDHSLLFKASLFFLFFLLLLKDLRQSLQLLGLARWLSGQRCLSHRPGW